MFPPTPNPESSSQPLPLFRAEALAAQQQKFYGDIVIIRPFSLTLLVWLGIGISAAVLGFLLLGAYTERATVGGVLLPGGREADLFLSAPTLKVVRAGQAIQIHCQSCSQIVQTKLGTVEEISKSGVSPDELPAQMNATGKRAFYRARVLLPRDGSEPFPEGARLEATLSLRRKPLLNWLFERRDSTQTGSK